jgi:hypothetical protein
VTTALTYIFLVFWMFFDEQGASRSMERPIMFCAFIAWTAMAIVIDLSYVIRRNAK